MPVLDFGFNVLIICRVVSIVIVSNFKLQSGLAFKYLENSLIGSFELSAAGSPIFTKYLLNASAIDLWSANIFPLFCSNVDGKIVFLILLLSA